MPSHLLLRTCCACAGLLAFALTGGCDRSTQPDQLGRPAPAITVNDGQHTLDLRALHGHVVLLNFWATWCGPCLVEMPGLEALQQQIPDLKVVGVAFDEDAPTYQAYLARHPLHFFSVLDTSGSAHTRFGTFRPPESYVIDKQGNIRQKYIGSQDWTSPEIVSTLQHLIQQS